MLTEKEIAVQLNTIGIQLSKHTNSYAVSAYSIWIDNEKIAECIGTKELKKWFISEGLNREYESIIESHGEKARKELTYYWN